MQAWSGVTKLRPPRQPFSFPSAPLRRIFPRKPRPHVHFLETGHGAMAGWVTFPPNGSSRAAFAGENGRMSNQDSATSAEGWPAKPAVR